MTLGYHTIIHMGLKGQNSKVNVRLGLWLTAIRRGFELYECLLVFWCITGILSFVTATRFVYCRSNIMSIQCVCCRCLKCCFWCLEKFIKFINRNAYIMVVLICLVKYILSFHYNFISKFIIIIVY